MNVPTKTSHLSNDSGFITSAALTGYATQSWVQGLGYITASALTPYITSATANATFATKLGVSGNQIGTYVNGKLGNLITVPYAANADTVDGLHKSSLGQTFYNIALDANSYENLPYLYAGKLFNATNVPYTYYPFLHFGGGGFYAQFSAYGNALKFRASRESDYTPEWRTVAFTDSNVASATKLQTARTLWGNSFNGEQNVGGDIVFDKSDGNRQLTVMKVGTFKFKVADGGWAWGMTTYALDGTTAIGGIGTYGVGDTLNYWYIGRDYNNAQFLVLPNGYVGVNKMPQYPLDVSGVIYSSSGIFSDGYMSAKGINTASDVRLKRRIADVALTVKDVAEAPVYRFAWINGGGIDVGSTAQYWAARVPELTHLLADGIHLGLDYGKAAVVGLVPVAKATLANTLDIAEHGRQLKELYSRIASLERQLQNRTI